MSSIDQAQKQAAQAGFYVSARPDGFQVLNKSEDLSPREPYFEAEEDAWDWAARRRKTLGTMWSHSAPQGCIKHRPAK